ncbi:MAG: LUD domain-containing protein [Solirubrobacteraceae bacterium]
MWHRIKNIFSPFNKESSFIKNKLDNNIVVPESQENIFITKFNSSGGKFIYCDNQDEISDTLHNIISENSLESIICFDNQLQNILSSNNISYHTSINPLKKENEFMFLNCENLIAFEGSIMVSSDQIKFFRVTELTRNLIIYSNCNQITTNLSSALRRIKSEKENNLPSNITTIKALKSNGFEDSTILKNIYLLMLGEIK